MASTALSIISALTQDIITYYSGLTGISTTGVGTGLAIAQGAFDKYQKGRQEKGRDVLLKRISEAQIDIADAADKDEAIGATYAYMQAVIKGTALINLDLLAQAIAGDLKRDQLYADNVHKYMNLLSSLTRDEIFVIGTYIRCQKEVYKEAEKRRELFLGSMPANTWNALMQTLVPSYFPTQEHVCVILGSLIRTGLVNALSSATIGLAQSHAFTILLEELSKLVDFEKSYKDYPDY